MGPSAPRPPASPARRLAASAALVLMVLAAAFGAAPARAAEPGVVPDLTWFPAEADQVRTATLLKDVGSRWVRLGIGWHDFEPQRGVYNSWSIDAYRRELQRARDAGQRVIVSVAGSPGWASGTSNPDSPPRDPADYARFVQYLAGEYGEYVDAWEVWNEPNISRFWPGGPNPAAYANLLKAAYPAIKSGDPTSTVLFGGLSQNDYAFVEAAYAAGAKGSFDVMATHPYACAAPETINREANGRMTKGSFPAYRELRASMLARGDDKPIWFTEFGWATTSKPCGVSEATQADYLRRAFRYVEQDPYVEVATWYDFRNNFFDHDADDNEAQYGLLRTDFSEKPSYAAFKSYAAGNSDPAPSPPPEPAPGPAPAPDAPPTVRLTAPASGSSFSTTLAMSAAASDDKGVARVEFTVDGKVVATDSSAPYSHSWRAPKKLAYGAHTVAARAYDTAGAQASDSVSVTRDRSAVTLSVAKTGATATSSSARRGRSLRAWGRVRQGRVRALELRLMRRGRNGAWRAEQVRRVSVAGRRFAVRFRGRRSGSFRVEARLPGRSRAAAVTRALRL